VVACASTAVAAIGRLLLCPRLLLLLLLLLLLRRVRLALLLLLRFLRCLRSYTSERVSCLADWRRTLNHDRGDMATQVTLFQRCICTCLAAQLPLVLLLQLVDVAEPALRRLVQVGHKERVHLHLACQKIAGPSALLHLAGAMAAVNCTTVILAR
jgi:hypothetical protein